MNEQLQLLDLTQVAITAMVEPTGRLGAVKGLWAKLLAAAHEAATVGLVRTVIVAADQPDVPLELELATTSPLRVLRAATLQDAVTKLYEEHGPQQAVRRQEQTQCATLDLLGRSAPFASHYQPLPLLRAVKRNRLPRARNAFTREDADGGALKSLDILRWEEELQGEQVRYETIPLEQLFENSPSEQNDDHAATPRIVVLGPPGSGKTALLQYLALRAANGELRVKGQRLLPVRVRLRDWETFTLTRTGGDRHLPSYLTQQYTHCDPAPSLPHWRRWLQNGEILLLLDGLDEMKGDSAFLTLFATTLHTFPKNPTVLTCRTVSFEQHKILCPHFPIFTLAGLDRAQRDAYIRAFPATHPSAYHPEKLIDRLRRSPQLLSLAANPLLLGIICYMADTTTATPFPKTRGQLYAQAVERLLTIRAQRVAAPYPGAAPAAHEKLAILQRAALQLFTPGDRQLTFSGRVVGQALKDAFREEGYGDASGPWANAFLEDVLHNSGVLRGDAERGFFFFHLTFQEFLAAAALAQQINDNGWSAPITAAGKTIRIAQFLDKKAWDPRWHEVIVLLAGQLADPLPLLTMLAQKKNDDVFSHRLALAVHGCAEVRLQAREKCARLVDRLTAETCEAWLHYETRGAGVVVAHLTRALPALKQLHGKIEQTPLLRWLQARLEDNNPDVRAGILAACAAIGESLASETDLLTALTASLSDPDVFVRVRTTEALRRLGATMIRRPEVLAALLQAGEHDPEWFVRSSVKRTLEQLTGETTQVPEAVSDFLSRQSSQFPTTTNGEIELVHSPGAPSSIMEEVTSIIALHDPNPEKRAKALAHLKAQGVENEQSSDTVSTLSEIVLHDTDGGIRARAADVLGQIGDQMHHYPNIAAILVTALQDRDAGVRAHVAAACGQLPLPEAYAQAVLVALQQALDDTDGEVRAAAAEALDRQMAKGLRLFKRWWGKKEVRTVEELTSI